MLILSCTPDNHTPFLWVEKKQEDCLPLLAYFFIRAPLSMKKIYQLFEAYPKLIFNLIATMRATDIKKDSDKLIIVTAQSFKVLLEKMQCYKSDYYLLSSLYFNDSRKVSAYLYPLDAVEIGENALASLRKLIIEDVLKDLD